MKENVVARVALALSPLLSVVACSDDVLENGMSSDADALARIPKTQAPAVGATGARIPITAADVAFPMRLYRREDGKVFAETSVASEDGGRSGSATIDFDVTHGGFYNVRLDVQSFKPTYNEIFFRIDGSERALTFVPTNFEKEEVVGEVYLQPGRHRLVIRGKAQFTRVSEIRFIPRLGLVDGEPPEGGSNDGGPVANGPLESVESRVFCDGKGLQWSNLSVVPNVAHCRMFYNGLYSSSVPAATVNTFVARVKALNPKTLVGVYIIVYETQDPGGPATTNVGFSALANKVSSMDWWLRTTSNARVQWTSSYASFNVCLTCGNTIAPDPNGERAPRALARVWGTTLAPMNVDFFYNDNAILQRQGGEMVGNVDYLGDGVGRKATDPAVIDAFKLAQHDFLDAMSTHAPKLFGVANVGPAYDAFDHPQVRQRWDGANIEGFMGLSWSVDSQLGWKALLQRTRALRDNLRGERFLSGMMTLERPVYSMIRYGLGTALLTDDVLFGLNIDSLGVMKSFHRVDEYEARLGQPAEPEPTQAKQNGIWFRRYQGGAVIVNPNDNRGTPLLRTRLTRQNGVVTLTGWPNHGVAVGTQVRIVDNESNRSFEGTFTVTASNAAAGTLSWQQAGANAVVASGSGRIATRSVIDLRGLGLRRIGGNDPKVGATFQDPSVNSGAPLGLEEIWSSDAIIAVNQ